MDQANILIVDDDRRLAAGLRGYLRTKREFGLVEWVASATEACEYVQVQPTDLVVLDLIMSGNDGYFFLERLQNMALHQKPHVIVTSSISHEHAIRKSMDMGAKYYMLKPYEHGIIYQRILDVLHSGAVEPPATTEKNINQKIMEIFLALGLPPHLKGYQYLREAVKIVLEDPAAIYSITRRLYPAVARIFEVTPTRVELAIRHTLEVAWQRNQPEDIKNVFGCSIYLKNVKPTNSEFIALVADKLASEL